MKRLFYLLLPGLLAIPAAPALPQTITVSPPATWKQCSAENAVCAAPAGALVRYGAGTKHVYRVVAGEVGCNNTVFGDPVLGTVKTCEIAAAGANTTPAPAPTPAPVPVPAPTPAPVPAPAPDTGAQWVNCAAEGKACKIAGSARVRFGVAGKYKYADAFGSLYCAAGPFGGDPATGVAKTCDYDTTTFVPRPVATAPVNPRDKLGVNVAMSNYWSNEFTFANQAYGIDWLIGWNGIDRALLADDGMPISVARGPGVQGFLMPPVTAYNGGDTTTICTWDGNADIWLFGDVAEHISYKPGSFEFRWKHAKPARTWMEIRYSDPANRMRNLDCRLKTTPKSEIYDPALLDYLKPFGTLRFLDWSRANSSPPLVTWDSRSKPVGVGKQGDDGVALEHMIGLANANGSSPWFTVPWGADANYHRQMAKMVHDSIPAGRQVYVELSNEVWNYMFGQTGTAEREGLAAGLSDNRFQAVLNRYAQKITEVMPIWAEVFKDRPADLVRVMATQSGNSWVGQQVMDWSKSAVAQHIDAIAIAPYFFVDASALTDDHETNMRLLEEASRREIAGPVVAYKELADTFGKRLIAYEGGQHMVDTQNVERREKMQRDARMRPIYREYLKGWNAVTPDLFTLYAATGSISQYGAWGLREYAGQPIAETPKLRGVVTSPH